MLCFLKYIFILHILHLVNSKRAYASYKGVDCYIHNATFFEDLECWMSRDAKAQNFMNAVLIFKKDLMNFNVRYTLLIDRQGRNETYISTNHDVCQALGEYHANFIERIIFEEIHRVSNFPLGCPIKKGIRYAINNFTINSKYIPAFVPALKWYSNAIFFVAKNKLFTFDTHGTVDLKKT